MATEVTIKSLSDFIGLRCCGYCPNPHIAGGEALSGDSDKTSIPVEWRGGACKGDCWDNAVVESFFGSLKQE